MPVGLFEVLVRPNVYPRIRPIPNPAPPPLDPEDRLVVLDSSSVTIIELNFTYSYSMSRTKIEETSRKFDVARISNVDDSSQFVDVEVITALKLRDADRMVYKRKYEKPKAGPNVEILKEDQFRGKK